MRKILAVAWREFSATVFTKSFLIGILIVPIIMTGAMVLVPLLISDAPPRVKGSVAVIDLSGRPADDPRGLAAKAITEKLSPEALREQLREDTDAAKAQAANAVRALAPTQAPMVEGALGSVKPDESTVPEITVEVLPTDADEQQAKEALLTGDAFDGSRLALVIVQPDAVIKPDGQADFGAFQLYVKAKLDVRAQRLLRTQIREALLEARIVANGENSERLRTLMRVNAPDTVEFTREGERKASVIKQMLVPLAFMLLLWISVFTGGQFLLYSTIEEKSNRVMEVLLSAVSPTQLMAGKIIGQMGAGLLVLGLYSGLGVVALIQFAMSDIIEPLHLVYLVAFFFIAFFIIASMMAAVGAAVTDIHEAQSLMTPVMLVIMTPMILMMPIIFNPKGTLATVMSFTPPVNPFVMVLRIASAEPPPTWQVLVSMLIGLITVYVVVRIAAKIFRVGVLMYGKPPNLATLIRWIRLA
ncbi:MAG: ABC transporter permease [Planctomycetota bacterium]|nr:ABC transporter permease [Planctomycetota bacterium]